MLDSLQIAPGTFAKKAGIATGTMYYLLQEGDATRSTLASIVRAAGASLDWLVMGTGPRPAQSPSPFFMKAAEVAFRKAFKSNWGGLSVEEKNGILTWAATLFVHLMSPDKEKAETEFLESGNNKHITKWVVQAVHLRAGLPSEDTVTVSCRALAQEHDNHVSRPALPSVQKNSRIRKAS